MIAIPAIDLKGGKVVRLKMGDPERETVYGDDPVAVARRWEEAGAEWLHVVDLDGAFDGVPRQAAAIGEVVRQTKLKVELGGGIRDLKTIDGYLAAGVERVILGTSAYTDPELVREASAKHPGRVAVGVDARDGKVALRGWTEITDADALEFALKMQEFGAAAIVYTDIGRDGMQTGANVPQTAALAKRLKIPVILSGGVTDIEDVKVIIHYAKHGIVGFITGRALYEGTLDLAEAIRYCKTYEG